MSTTRHAVGDTREDRKVRIGDGDLRELRRQLLAGEITAEEAQRRGFPPTAPIEETRA